MESVLFMNVASVYGRINVRRTSSPRESGLPAVEGPTHHSSDHEVRLNNRAQPHEPQPLLSCQRACMWCKLKHTGAVVSVDTLFEANLTMGFNYYLVLPRNYTHTFAVKSSIQILKK